MLLTKQTFIGQYVPSHRFSFFPGSRQDRRSSVHPTVRLCIGASTSKNAPRTTLPFLWKGKRLSHISYCELSRCSNTLLCPNRDQSCQLPSHSRTAGCLSYRSGPSSDVGRWTWIGILLRTFFMASHGEGPKNDQANEAKATKDINGPEPGIIDAQQSSPSPRDLKRSSTTPYLSAASSAANSPKPSREGSPTRPSLKSSASIGPRSTTRSRKNSQDLSPIRAPSASGANIPTVPSAAAIQRALSAAGTPHFPSPSTPDFVTDSPRPQKANRIVTGSTQQAGSNSPRVKSPPLSASSGSNKPVLTTARKIEQSQPTPTPTTPTIIVDRPTRSSTFASEFDVAEEDHTPRSGMRTPSRGISGNGPALETVQESSFPATPAISTARSAQTNKGSLNDRPERIDENPMEEALGKEAISRSESGNESPGNKSGEAKGVDGHKETRKPAAAVRSAKPPMVQSKKSFSQLPFTKAKTASEGGVRNLIVETETVSSIPQVALGGGAGERTTLGRTETGGSLRLKPSNETIRPKKEKKKVVRKAPSVNSGAGGFTSRRLHHHHILSRSPSYDDYSISSSLTSRTLLMTKCLSMISSSPSLICPQAMARASAHKISK